MSEAIGQLLPLAVGVSLSPIPIVGVVLMLGTPAGSRNGPAFLVGWIAGISIAAGAVLLIASGAGAGEGGEPAGWVSWLKIALGGLLLAVAVRQWRSRPAAGAEPELPGWMRSVDHFTARRAIALGLALSALNPKNLILIIAAAAAVAQTGIEPGDEIVALAAFVVIATLGPAIPVAIYFGMRERATGLLADLKDWLGVNSGAIMAVLCLVIAAKLIGDGISGLG